MSDTSRLPDITGLMARRLRCPRCMRRFRPQDIAIIETASRFGVFRLRCPMCTSQRLVIAVWHKNMVRTYPTDLDAQEWAYYRHAPPINTDDVLRMVQLMNEYDGDFSDVLEDPLFDEHD